MKKINFLLLLFTLSIITPFYAQEQKNDYVPFPMENAEWINLYIHDLSFYIQTKHYTANETIDILGNTYHKILFYGDEQFYIRETDDKKVYAVFVSMTEEFGYEQEVLLYDFGVELGDTIWYDYRGFTYDGGDILFVPYSHYYVVKDITDFNLLDGETRKAYKLESSLIDVWYDLWVEGIGSTKSILGPYCNNYLHVGIDDEFYMTCFKLNNELLYKRQDCPDCECKLCYVKATIYGSGGNIEPPAGNHNFLVGDNASYQFFPDPRHEVKDVLVDGISNPQAIENRKYTFYNINAHHTLDVFFSYLSIENFSNELSIYPNPVTNLLTIEFQNYQIKEISIFDITGKEIQTINNVNSNITNINITNLAKGIYNLRINTVCGKAVNESFIKE